MLDSYMQPTILNQSKNQIDETNKNRLDMTDFLQEQRGHSDKKNRLTV